jgi:ribonuclease VapC
MVIDTSAVIALLEGEVPAPALRIAIAADSIRLISSMSVLEATCVIGARRGVHAVSELRLFLYQFHIEIVAFDAAELEVAQTAWLRYGRGFHPAGLNFGDCAPYALARRSGEPLLFVGNDFRKTDVTIVDYGQPA